MTEPGLSSQGPLQFGLRDPARGAYADRPAAFAVIAHQGRVALAFITRPDGRYHDLPGGALEDGEDDAAAMVREVGEEIGLRVRPTRLLGRASQFMIKVEGDPVNNRCALFEAEILAENPALKIEDDHQLVWAEPAEAIALLRHDAHAWAVTLWLRREGRPSA